MFVGGAGGMLGGMELPARFDFVVSIQDHCASHLVCEEGHEKCRQQSRKTGFKIAAVSLACIAVGVAGHLANQRGVLEVPAALVGALWVIGGLSGWFAWAMIFTKPMKPEPAHTLPPSDRLKAMESSPLFRAFLGPEAVTITDRAIHEDRGHSSVRVDWEEMDRVIRGPEHLFVRSLQKQIFMVPHRALDGVDVEELCRVVEGLIEAKRPAT